MHRSVRITRQIHRAVHTTGIASSMPAQPNALPPVSTLIITAGGVSPVAPPVMRGVISRLSICCTSRTEPIVSAAGRIPPVSAQITAGIPPMNGPK